MGADNKRSNVKTSPPVVPLAKKKEQHIRGKKSATHRDISVDVSRRSKRNLTGFIIVRGVSETRAKTGTTIDDYDIYLLGTSIFVVGTYGNRSNVENNCTV